MIGKRKKWKDFKVVDIINETANVKSFVLQPLSSEDSFDYRAGQYLTLKIDDDKGVSHFRSYTISSAPSEKFIVFTVKRVQEGLVSNWMCDHLSAGARVSGLGPLGVFCYEPSNCKEKLVMIGAGSGVTPFLSIIKDLMPKYGTNKMKPGKVVLMSSFRSEKDIIQRKTFELAASLKNTSVNFYLTQNGLTRDTTVNPRNSCNYFTGRIDSKAINGALFSDFKDTTFMVCGPKPFMDQCVDILKNAGVDEDDILIESFF